MINNKPRPSRLTWLLCRGHGIFMLDCKLHQQHLLSANKTIVRGLILLCYKILFLKRKKLILGFFSIPALKKEGKLGANAMVRVAAGAHLSTPASSDDRAPTIGRAAHFSPSANTRYSFLHLRGHGRALWANSAEGSGH